MPDYQHIVLEKDPDEYIARLTINRPQRRNALNDLTMDELGDALEDVDADDSVRVLVVTGAGSHSVRVATWKRYRAVASREIGCRIMPTTSAAASAGCTASCWPSNEWKNR